MGDAPETCPTCATAVPEGAPRCPGCGRVFGEENRCPHCHAVAAVIKRGGTTVCAACGKPRAGTVVLGGEGKGGIIPASRVGREASTSAMMTRARGRTQRGFGILALSAGIVVAALAAALVPGAVGIGLAVAGGLLGVGTGALSIRAGAKNMEKARRDEARATEIAVYELAEEQGGSLTASVTATALRISPDEADDLLTSLVGDGSRIEVDVDEEGVVSYVFRELVAKRPKVRVEEVEEPAEEVAEEVPEAAAEREREA